MDGGPCENYCGKQGRGQASYGVIVSTACLLCPMQSRSARDAAGSILTLVFTAIRAGITAPMLATETMEMHGKTFIAHRGV